MTLTEIIEAASKRTGLPKKDVSSVLHTSLGLMTEALLEDEKVSLRGYANLKTVRSPQRNMFKSGKVAGGLRRVSLSLPRKSKWKNMP